MLDSAIDHVAGWPQWLHALLIYGAFLAAAVVLHSLLYRVLDRAVRNAGLFRRALVQRTRRPARLALLLLALAGAAELEPLAPEVAGVLRTVGRIGFIVLLGLLANTVLHVWSVAYMRRFKIDVADNLVARKHVTQVKILRRAAMVLIALLTAAAALLTIPSVEKIGVSLLASAGFAGLVVGLALQPVLTNLLAGVQIALTQPIRIDDAVIVEGEFGHIEDITTTYVVVKLWDLRRMILPLNWFIQNPFQNWTRETANLIGAVYVYVDFSAPMDAIRAKVEELARASPLWDGEVVGVQVTDATERTMQVRCLVGARTSGDAWDLRCQVREGLIAWLKEEHPDALPRERLGLAPSEAPAGA